jgi:hypothetical protein
VIIELPDDMIIPTRKAWSFLIRAKAGFRCEECGEPGDEAHHINGNGRDHRLSNGECLCQLCHGRKTHGGRVHSEEHRRKNALARRAYWATLPEGERERIKAGLKLGSTDPESLAKRAAAKLGVPLSPAHRAAIARGRKAAWDRKRAGAI